jgi:beta-phosphoglucomutase family hydrolase
MVVITIRRFDAFIFDLDGVITQTAAVHARAWKKLFDSFLARDAAQTGKPFVPFDAETDYRLYVDGKPRVAGVVSFLASRNIELPVGKDRDGDELNTTQGLAERKDQYFSEILSSEGVRVFDSTVALLTEARERGMRTAVASSSHHCVEILRSAKLTDFFDARVDGFDIDHLGLAGKPAPDMFLEAARRLDVSPARGVVFEDATSGVAAAHAGGFGLVIGIGDGRHATDLLESGADEVVVNLSEVKLKGSRRHLEMP